MLSRFYADEVEQSEFDCCNEAPQAPNMTATEVKARQGAYYDKQKAAVPTPLAQAKVLKSFAEMKAAKKKESAMNAPDINVNIDTTSTSMDLSQKTYLRERAYEIWHAKHAVLETKFNICDDAPPATVKDFVQRIKDGKWTTDSEKDLTRKSWQPTNYILWRDPARVADTEGYDAAKVVLGNQFQAIKDTIVIKTPAEALSEMRTWETAN